MVSTVRLWRFVGQGASSASAAMSVSRTHLYNIFFPALNYLTTCYPTEHAIAIGKGLLYIFTIDNIISIPRIGFAT